MGTYGVRVHSRGVLWRGLMGMYGARVNRGIL